MKMSFNNPGYITSGFHTEIPLLAQIHIILEIEELSKHDSGKADYLQVFRLN